MPSEVRLLLRLLCWLLYSVPCVTSRESIHPQGKVSAEKYLSELENKLIDLDKKQSSEVCELELQCQEEVARLQRDNKDKVDTLRSSHRSQRQVLTEEIERVARGLQPPPASAPVLPVEAGEAEAASRPPVPECPVCFENMLPPR